MAEVFRTTRRVEFRETDAAGIAHLQLISVLYGAANTTCSARSTGPS